MPTIHHHPTCLMMGTLRFAYPAARRVTYGDAHDALIKTVEAICDEALR